MGKSWRNYTLLEKDTIKASVLILIFMFGMFLTVVGMSIHRHSVDLPGRAMYDLFTPMLFMVPYNFFMVVWLMRILRRSREGLHILIKLFIYFQLFLFFVFALFVINLLIFI